MLILHVDWQGEEDAEEIFALLKKRIPYNRKGEFLPINAKMLSDYEESEKIYQLFPDPEGCIGVFCDSKAEDYLISIRDTSPCFCVDLESHAT
jgi:hypothetical protein